MRATCKPCEGPLWSVTIWWWNLRPWHTLACATVHDYDSTQQHLAVFMKRYIYIYSYTWYIYIYIYTVYIFLPHCSVTFFIKNQKIWTHLVYKPSEHPLRPSEGILAEIGRNPVSEHQIDDSAWVWRRRRLTRDGTAEPVSRDQILRREQGHGKVHFFLFSWPWAGLATLPGWSILCLLYAMTIHTSAIAPYLAIISCHRTLAAADVPFFPLYYY